MLTRLHYIDALLPTLRAWPAARPSFDEVAFGIAFLWAARSTCDRLAAGCVAMNAHHHVVAAGYNGSPSGAPHCSGPDGMGHLLVDNHCQRTLHAEHNMVLQAGLAQLTGTQVFQTARPCQICAKFLVQARVQAVHFWAFYNTDGVADQVETMFRHADIPLIGPYVDEHARRLR